MNTFVVNLFAKPPEKLVAGLGDDKGHSVAW